MSDDVKLQKLILSPDWIDLSFGEPSIVMKSLYKQVALFDNTFKLTNPSNMLEWTYQPASGYPDLVKVLEAKYKAKVVVCNGAKHALAAALFALKKAGIKTCHYGSPYYPANPQILNALGIQWAPESEAESLLITSPNNPCGSNLSNSSIRDKSQGRPCIHDAAYYTEIYLPDTQRPESLCDIQVFSVSKMYGLSGLRIGYAVVYNERYYQDIVNYVELTTAGVSIVSQNIVKNIESFFIENPEYLTRFHADARQSIADSRNLLTLLHPDVLMPEPCESNSMFAWCKVGPRLNNKAAKVHMLPGKIFGQPGYMRLNIAYPVDVVADAIKRLNDNKL